MKRVDLVERGLSFNLIMDTLIVSMRIIVIASLLCGDICIKVIGWIY